MQKKSRQEKYQSIKRLTLKYKFKFLTNCSLFQAAKKPLIVGAIDFGTTFSGWGYCFLHEYKSDPTKANVRHWYGGQLVKEKTPTCALITPRHKLEAFGYEAENKFKDLVENGEHHSYYYFR